MRNQFLVSIKCPECGAPARYSEGAYSFKCPYCASVLRTEFDARDLKYIIPSKLSQKEIALAVKRILVRKGVKRLPVLKRIIVVYKPFWRFSGMIYRVFTHQGKIEAIGKTWSHSFEAHDGFAPALSTLGVKTEVLTLHPFNSEEHGGTGVFLPLTISKEEALETASAFAEKNIEMEIVSAIGGAPRVKKRISLWNSALDITTSIQSPDKRADAIKDLPGAFSKLHITGKRLFIVYYPVIEALCKGLDGYSGLRLDGLGKEFIEETGDAVPRPSGAARAGIAPSQIRLLTHRCKNCGHDLPPRDFDIVYFCRNCRTLWLLARNDYHRVELNAPDPGNARNIVYIPMWTFEAVLKSKKAEANIDSVGDLARFMKMGDMILRDRNPGGKLKFSLLAMVSRNAGALLKFAANLSRAQMELPETPGYPDLLRLRMMNVSLPPEEAREMLYPLVCSVVNRTDPLAMDFYSDLQIETRRCELVWRPFIESGYNCIDCFTRLSLPRRALDIHF